MIKLNGVPVSPAPVLLLTGPYGYETGSGHGLSLIRDDWKLYDAVRLAYALAEHSCYLPAIPKIRACIEASGRYDCLVMWGVVHEASDLTLKLNAIGIRALFERTSVAMKYWRQTGGSFELRNW